MKSVKLLLPAFLGTLLFGGTISVGAQASWTSSDAPSAQWVSIAGSADGMKWMATANRSVVDPGGGSTPVGTYVSTNWGLNWTFTGPTNNFEFVACSADGSQAIGAKASGLTDQISLSTNSGVTWNSATTFSGLPGAVACSADGSIMLAGLPGSGGLYISTNHGASWLSHITTLDGATFVACSADGTKRYAAGANYTSGSSHMNVWTNVGDVWKAHTPVLTWSFIACSASGKKVVASVYGGGIYTSTNYGTTWLSNNVPPTNWVYVASSADGVVLAAVYENNNSGGGIFTSTNSGATWQSNNVTGRWLSVAMSADGNRRVAGATPGGSAGGIDIAYSSTSPRINLAPVDAGAFLSWTVPSTNFVLQSSADLSAWTDLTNTPVLNLTNLQDEVTLPPDVPATFYRLKTP